MAIGICRCSSFSGNYCAQNIFCNCRIIGMNKSITLEVVQALINLDETMCDECILCAKHPNVSYLRWRWLHNQFVARLQEWIHADALGGHLYLVAIFQQLN